MAETGSLVTLHLHSGPILQRSTSQIDGPHPSQTAPPTEDQVFRQVSLYGTWTFRPHNIIRHHEFCFQFLYHVLNVSFWMLKYLIRKLYSFGGKKKFIIYYFLKMPSEQVIVAHACNFSSWNDEAEGLLRLGQAWTKQ